MSNSMKILFILFLFTRSCLEAWWLSYCVFLMFNFEVGPPRFPPVVAVPAEESIDVAGWFDGFFDVNTSSSSL